MRSFANLFLLAAVLVACICAVNASPVEERSVAVSMTPTKVNTLFAQKKKTPRGTQCLLNQPGNAATNDAYLLANAIQHHGGSYTFQGRNSYGVGTYNNAAVYLSVIQYGKATVSYATMGKYATKAINECKKHGKTHANIDVAPEDYTAKGFHKTRNSVIITVRKPLPSS